MYEGQATLDEGPAKKPGQGFSPGTSPQLQLQLEFSDSGAGPRFQFRDTIVVTAHPGVHGEEIGSAAPGDTQHELVAVLHDFILVHELQDLHVLLVAKK